MCRPTLAASKFTQENEACPWARVVPTRKSIFFHHFKKLLRHFVSILFRFPWINVIYENQDLSRWRKNAHEFPSHSGSVWKSDWKSESRTPHGIQTVSAVCILECKYNRIYKSGALIRDYDYGRRRPSGCREKIARILSAAWMIFVERSGDFTKLRNRIKILRKR